LNYYIDVGSPWKAVADDSRRQMLLLLKDEEKTPSQISASFDFTFPAVSTHLRVLRDAGLVTERKEGKNRYYSVNFETLTGMLSFFDGFWDQKLAGLKGHAKKKGKIKVVVD
jgi:ArsR family transcriptional regulator